MDSIFHEKQEGSLCAQHCLNSLLQGSYFTAVDLSVWAEKLDEEERVRMAECGEESEDYRNFLKQPSGNMDDSGFFSIQVISKALQVWGLEIVPYTSADERVKNCDPSKMQAFICNYQSHWFTIRRIGNQWFNLNSLLAKPVLISDTYLSLFLAQLKNEGYSIFVVFGELPPCTADEIIRCNPVMAPTRPTLTSTSSYEDDPELQAALKLSLSQEFDSNPSNSEDEELQRALMLSLSCDNPEEDEHANVKKALLMSMNNVCP
ncbi:Josephin domain containing protein [Asbolus verrucosus]|uniref:ubiquitinyl hydrolase 1 n=1 Tax=Asbolus verrucosus TaxID=1661398 RepID=A0A482VWU3_ASBVE|nr:Josephin domain containing protein [Asbolus verrucosus]